jgi:hypothetical protein
VDEGSDEPQVLNHGSLSADELQHMMRHKRFVTTRRYISQAGQLMQSVEKPQVPDVFPSDPSPDGGPSGDSPAEPAAIPFRRDAG